MRRFGLLLSLTVIGALGAQQAPAATAKVHVATLTVQVEPTAVAGEALTVTVTAVDRHRRLKTDYHGTVLLTSSDPRAVLPPPYTFTQGDAGVHTFSGVVLKTAGSQWLQIADERRAWLRRTVPVQVTPADAAALQLAAPGVVDAGQTFAATATATDAFGNEVGDVTDATTFSVAPDGSCTGASCRVTVAGGHTLTAVSGAAATSTPLTVTAGPLATLTIGAPRTVTAGDTFAVTATGTDAFGNTEDLTGQASFSLTPDGLCTAAGCGATITGDHTVTGAVAGLSDDAAVAVGPAALDHLVLSPASAHVAGAPPAIADTDFAPLIARSQAYAVEGFDTYGNSRGDVTAATTLTTDGTAQCTGASCRGVSPETATVTGTAGTATGTAQLITDPVLTAYTISCQGEHYDVDGSIANGCEATPSPAGNTTQATAVSQGSRTCFNASSDPDISGTLASDARTHANPAVAGFDAVTGTASKWWEVTAAGGACGNDVVMTLTVTGSASPACYKLSVLTSAGTYTAQTDAGGVATISSGTYADDTTIAFRVQKTCALPLQESVSFAVRGHL